MSNLNYTNDFNWDQHVVKDPDMGYTLILSMNAEQKCNVQSYSQNQIKAQSFPTALSLPFMNNSNQWKIQTRWNNMNKIYDSDAYNIAAQLEKIYMAFVGEAINRPYAMLNKYDPANFYNEVLHSIQQLAVNTYVKWKDTFGQVNAKNPNISKNHCVFEWRLHEIQAYRVQVINQDETISNKRVVLTTQFISITGDPGDISVYNDEQDVTWAILQYAYQTKSNQLQQLQEVWNQNCMELDTQIIKAIDYYLRNKYINKMVDGLSRKCFVVVKSAEFENHLVCKTSSIGLDWKLNSKHNNSISLSLAQLQQSFGSNAGKRIHVITDKQNKEFTWTYFSQVFFFRYSYACKKMFIKFMVLGKDPHGDVIATG